MPLYPATYIVCIGARHPVAAGGQGAVLGTKGGGEPCPPLPRLSAVFVNNDPKRFFTCNVFFFTLQDQRTLALLSSVECLFFDTVKIHNSVNI